MRISFTASRTPATTVATDGWAKANWTAAARSETPCRSQIARSRWARDWLGWDQYRQFWTQTAQWALRRVDSADFASEVTIDKGEGVLGVEALGPAGEFRNFLQLQAVVVSPKGERSVVRLSGDRAGKREIFCDALAPRRAAQPLVGAGEDRRHQNLSEHPGEPPRLPPVARAGDA